MAGEVQLIQALSVNTAFTHSLRPTYPQIQSPMLNLELSQVGAVVSELCGLRTFIYIEPSPSSAYRTPRNTNRCLVLPTSWYQVMNSGENDDGRRGILRSPLIGVDSERRESGVHFERANPRTSYGRETMFAFIQRQGDQSVFIMNAEERFMHSLVGYPMNQQGAMTAITMVPREKCKEFWNQPNHDATHYCSWRLVPDRSHDGESRETQGSPRSVSMASMSDTRDGSFASSIVPLTARPGTPMLTAREWPGSSTNREMREWPSTGSRHPERPILTSPSPVRYPPEMPPLRLNHERQLDYSVESVHHDLPVIGSFSTGRSPSLHDESASDHAGLGLSGLDSLHSVPKA